MSEVQLSSFVDVQVGSLSLAGFSEEAVVKGTTFDPVEYRRQKMINEHN